MALLDGRERELGLLYWHESPPLPRLAARWPGDILRPGAADRGRVRSGYPLGDVPRHLAHHRDDVVAARASGPLAPWRLRSLLVSIWRARACPHLSTPTLACC